MPPAGRPPRSAIMEMVEPFGVYVHIPFCSRRCDYCAFATWTDRSHLADEYVHACVTAIRGTAVPPASSIYFGGGTPSLIASDLLTGILGAIPRQPGCEVTVECNPETVDEKKLATYRAAGVTRLSLGVQSMVPEVLASLGRRHDAHNVVRAVEAAAICGFGDRYSVDLIFGAAGESLADWEASLHAVLALDPQPSHVSAYGLTVEAGTPLARDASRYPDPDDQADKYLVADKILADHGFEWYEISNWAKPGAECRHNQLYWQQGNYLGFGCAAHSHQVRSDGSSRRWWNVRTPERYIRLVGSGESVVAAEDRLDDHARALEALQLSLRTRDGVPAAALSPPDDVSPLLEPGPDGRVVLTQRGRLLANEVAIRLVVPAGFTGHDVPAGHDEKSNEETSAR